MLETLIVKVDKLEGNYTKLEGNFTKLEKEVKEMKADIKTIKEDVRYLRRASDEAFRDIGMLDDRTKPLRSV